MLSNYIKEAIALKKLSHQLSKDKLVMLSNLLNNKKFKKSKLNSLEVIEKFKFIYGHYYPIATIKKLLTYDEPFKAFKFYKLGSSFLIDNNGEIELNVDKVKVIKRYSWLFVIIGLIFTGISLFMLLQNSYILVIIGILVSLSIFGIGIYNLNEMFFADLFIKKYIDK